MSIKKPQIKIDLMNKYLELMNLIFEEKDMGFYHDQMGSIFDKVIVVEEDSLKIAVIVVNYFIDELYNKKVLGINPILVNPNLIDKGYCKKII